ncbi:MAG: CBS domain-containing protein [Marinobacter sp.]|uniref:CBS domain-containing protein n=1 Tax=Marinobacter sp. TaxID=50741 RepID=UPI00299E5975|nr:CBS domain-containing protein [Marinobacter sp.]MDX1634271.1 CBS domain-containing protein [Marinobacter sp.]
MAIFVSEPGRPIGTRLPESARSRRTPAVTETDEIQKPQPGYNENTDPAFLNAQQVTARRALAEYGEASESSPEAQRPYLPVSRICSTYLYSVEATDTMATALATMDEHGVHHLVVMTEGEVAGLIGLSWLLDWIHRNRANAATQTFTQVELPAFLTATPETDAHQLARLMLAHQLNAALVLDFNGGAKGLVTSTDYLRLYADISRQEGSV